METSISRERIVQYIRNKWKTCRNYLFILQCYKCKIVFKRVTFKIKVFNRVLFNNPERIRLSTYRSGPVLVNLAQALAKVGSDTHQRRPRCANEVRSR